MGRHHTRNLIIPVNIKLLQLLGFSWAGTGTYVLMSMCPGMQGGMVRSETALVAASSCFPDDFCRLSTVMGSGPTSMAPRGSQPEKQHDDFPYRSPACVSDST
jgi:hypothetical protein